MTLVWSVNAFFQSMGWAALVTTMSRWYGPREQGTAMGIISTSYQVGNAAAWGLMSVLVLALPWTWLFTAPALAFALIGSVCWFLLRNDPRDVGEPSPHHELNTTSASAAADAERDGKAAAKEILRRTLLSPYLWAVCVMSLLLTFVRYTFINWAPTYLSERGAGISAGALESAVFPLVGCAGSILAGWFSDRFCESRRAPVIVILCSALVLTLVGFGFAAKASPTVMVLLMALAGFTLFGPYSLLAGAIAIDLGSRHAAATAAGIIDAVGYLGAVLSGAGMGWVVDQIGWEQSFLVLAAATGVCVVVALFLWRFQPGGTRRA